MLATALARIATVLAADRADGTLADPADATGATEADTTQTIDDQVTPSSRTHRQIAVGWATVELDRAAADLADVLGLAPEAFAPAADSIALGARCRIATRVLAGGLSLVILEPVAEGRLAAALARLGEGPSVVWSRRAPSSRVAAGAARPGPFGPERLVSHAPRQSPIRLLLDGRPGTIAE
jgi:hypothetical protein